jgi:hypothetical protein
MTEKAYIGDPELANRLHAAQIGIARVKVESCFALVQKAAAETVSKR